MEEPRSWVIIDRESTQVIDRCDILRAAEEKARKYKMQTMRELIIEKR